MLKCAFGLIKQNCLKSFNDTLRMKQIVGWVSAVCGRLVYATYCRIVTEIKDTIASLR